MDDTDVYIDNDEFITSYLYEPDPIPESLLPPVFYAKRGDKRMKLDTSPVKKQLANATNTTANAFIGLVSTTTTISQPLSSTITSSSTTSSSVKAVKMENIIMSRPLFDKPNTALIKLRRDIKMQKIKGWTNYKSDVIKSTLPLPTNEMNNFHRFYECFLPH